MLLVHVGGGPSRYPCKGGYYVGKVFKLGPYHGAKPRAVVYYIANWVGLCCGIHP